MKVIRAKVLGFCFGVKRAVSAAEKALEEGCGRNKIYTLGPLIHNPAVLEEFTKKGLSVVEEQQIDSLENNAIVIIRAHGTTPSVLQKLASKNVRILDATCPRVHASQKLAAEWAGKGYTVVIAGDKNHGEVTGISGYAHAAFEAAENNVIVVQNIHEAQKMVVPEKTVLLAQTTFSPELFKEIEAVLRDKNTNILVFNTICTATMERQNALKELAGAADGIIVIGGKISANTRRLFETAKSICQNTALIEKASQIPESFFSLEKVALTAGASTPDEVIDEVEMKLLSGKI